MAVAKTIALSEKEAISARRPDYPHKIFSLAIID